MSELVYVYDKKKDTKSFHVEISTSKKYGWFEHHTRGDECGGGLWFDNELRLIDYDGVFELPKEVIQAIRDLGCSVSKEFE